MKKKFIASLLLMAMLVGGISSQVHADSIPVTKLHTVVAGETWDSIAKTYGLTAWTLGALNGYTDDALVNFVLFSKPIAGQDVIVGITRVDVPGGNSSGGSSSSASPAASASAGASTAPSASSAPTATPTASASPSGSANPSGSASPVASSGPSYVMRERTHKLKKGDTLFSLAQYYGTTVDQLKAWNPTVKEKGLKIGDRLIVAYLLYDSTASIPPDPDVLPSGYYESKLEQKHIVAKGETVFGIAKTYGLTVNQLKKLNPSIGKKNIITPGQELVVGHETRVVNAYATPYYTPTPSIYAYNYQNNVDQYTNKPSASSSVSNVSNGYYTVQAGDYLYKIAKANGLTLAQIKDLNPGISSTLAPGQQIRIK